MEEKTTATLERIQLVAMEEFAEKGFLGASLRLENNIVLCCGEKNRGVMVKSVPLQKGWLHGI